MFRKISLAAVAVALAAVFAFAQEGEKKSVKVTGYVVDNMCAEMHGSEAEAKNQALSYGYDANLGTGRILAQAPALQ